MVLGRAARADRRRAAGAAAAARAAGAAHTGELLRRTGRRRAGVCLRCLQRREIRARRGGELTMAQETAPQAIARLVAYAPGKYIALPPHATVEIVEHPTALPVPGAAHHAHGLLAWQGRQIAMIDLQALVAGRIDGQALSAPRYALVVAYQRRAGEAIEHGALALPFLPETITVSDDAACALP